jgi:hypothetical protein
VFGRTGSRLDPHASEVGHADSLLGSGQTDQPGGIVAECQESVCRTVGVSGRLDEDGRWRASFACGLLATKRVCASLDVRNLRTSHQFASHGSDRLAIDTGHEGKTSVREAREASQRLGHEVSTLCARQLSPLDVRADDEGDPFLVGAEVSKLLHGLGHGGAFSS